MKKIFCIILLMSITLTMLSGCALKKIPFPEEIAYNAVLYDSAGEWIKEDFNNKVNLELHDLGEISLFVNSKEEYNEIFKKEYELLDINYDEEMIIVYIYFSMQWSRKFLYSVELNEDILTIKYAPRYETGSVNQPYLRYFVVIMDKVQASSAEFINLG